MYSKDKGDLFKVEGDGSLFIVYTAVWKASHQKEKKGEKPEQVKLVPCPQYVGVFSQLFHFVGVCRDRDAEKECP